MLDTLQLYARYIAALYTAYITAHC